MVAQDDLVLARVASVFGLGVVYSATAGYAGRLASFLAPFDASPLLERLEHNRLTLYLRVIDLEDELAATLLRVHDVAVENRALWARNAELSAATREVARSRAFGLAERLSGLKARSSSSPGLSRRRLEELADDSLDRGQA